MCLTHLSISDWGANISLRYMVGARDKRNWATRLAVALPEGLDLRALLGESGLPFVPVPGMPSHRPSTSFKLPGAEALALDLLVPGAQLGEVLPVAELAAHGQAIPLLDFLVAKPIDAVVLSPNQVIPVQVPSPERFLLHKLFSSQSRRTGHGVSLMISRRPGTCGIVAIAAAVSCTVNPRARQEAAAPSAL